MRNKYFTILLVCVAFGLKSCIKSDKTQSNSLQSIPVPTEVIQNMNNEELYENRKELWLESIHQSANGVNWREINAQNFNIIAKQRANQQQKAVEQFANGFLEGEWFERGSNNQAGNLMNVDFEKNSELIYGIAVNGSLWRSNLNGTSWQVLNNNLLFNTNVIKVVELSAGQRRILVSKGKQIKYSDDEGQTWQNANGFNNSNGKPIDLIQLNDANNTLVYLYYDSDIPANKVAVSVDNGITFNDVQTLLSASSNGHKASMTMFNNGTKAYILDANNGMYIYENGNINQISVGSGFNASNYFKLDATATPTDTTLYVLRDKSELYKSTDNGMTFNLVATLPVNSWEVGIEVAEDDPNAVYFGEVELYRSVDGGVTYTNNNWADYYNDVANEVHADIMRLKSFVKNDGTEFCLICNHGGISISYDHLQTTPNIGMSDLNIGQFYDVITNPIDPYRMYGGTQDQGMQYTNSAQGTSVLSLEQAISGDYGHMQVSNNGQVLWAQYPGALFYIFDNLLDVPGYVGSHNVDGVDMPAYNWIVPTAAAPNVADNYIYVAGGDINGGNGSHLIKLEYNNGNVTASQFDFDFKQASGDEISAINASKVDTNKLYVGTENGQFYYSNDNGLSWNEGQILNGPGAFYLYGACIASANQTSGLVFFGGSGYSNSPCFMSTDGGETFTPIQNGLPNTLVLDMVMSPDDEFLFAATDAGPYVYYLALDEWFYLGGTTAPVGSYYSVDYVNDLNIVRFGTHGRGIWDLNITKNSASVNETSLGNEVMIYPNPIAKGGQIVVSNLKHQPTEVFIYDLNGKQIKHQAIQTLNQLTLTAPKQAGVYLIVVKNNSQIIVAKQLIVQ